MDFIIQVLTDWLKEILVSGIMGNLTGMFDEVNQKVGEVSTQVGLTPQAWNRDIFSMVQNLSETVMVPISLAVTGRAHGHGTAGFGGPL